MYVGGSYEANIGSPGALGNPNPYFNRTERFTFAQFGFRLVTGIYAYNESTAMSLIDRSATALGARGTFVLDTDASKGYGGGWGGYGYANSALMWASAILNARGLPNFLDTNNTYVTGQTNVMGYSSWGSNDCCWGSVTQYAKPMNSWENGSIAESFVSTGGRSFTWPPSYGQSLIADWIDEGVTGMKGYTDEPYISAIADGHILYGRYTGGYNLAESFWAASHVIGWRQIVIGDPKMAPYADGTDLAINTTLTAAPSSAAQMTAVNISVGVDNIGISPRDIAIRAQFDVGPAFDFDVTVPAFEASQFTLSLDMGALGPGTWGQLNLTVTVDPDGLVGETDEGNNTWTAVFEVQRRPEVGATITPQSLFTFDSATITLFATRADRALQGFEVEWDGQAPAFVPAVSEAAAFSVNYPKSGTHFLFVRAIDTAGLASDRLGPLVLTVLNRPPTVNVTANESAPLSMVPVSFSANASFDPDGNITSIVWTAGALGSGSGPNFTLTFPRPGNFTVSALITDDEGGFSSASYTITVGNRAPVAMAVANRSAALSGEFFDFDASASFDLDGTVMSYAFDFDDGASLTQVGPTLPHAFAAPGPAGAWVTVTDDFGATTRTRVDIHVLDRPPTIALSVGPSVMVNEGGTLAFSARLDDPDSPLLSFSVEFGDGARADRNLNGRSMNLSFSHDYPLEGRFTVTARLYDAEGNSTTATLSVNVTHPAPVIDDHALSAQNATLHLEYSIITPYETDLRLIIKIDGSAWKSLVVGTSGVRDLDLSELAPGNHSVIVEVTDGVKTTELGRLTLTIAEPAPPPPTTGGNGGSTGGGGSLFLLYAGVAGAVGAAALGFLFMRRRSAGDKSSPAEEKPAAPSDDKERP
jgi:uncharacterized protein (TIGR03790 family)